MLDKPMPIGSRVYKKHRKMLRALARKNKTNAAEALRQSIEHEAEREGIKV